MKYRCIRLHQFFYDISGSLVEIYTKLQQCISIALLEESSVEFLACNILTHTGAHLHQNSRIEQSIPRSDKPNGYIDK